MARKSGPAKKLSEEQRAELVSPLVEMVAGPPIRLEEIKGRLTELHKRHGEELVQAVGENFPELMRQAYGHFFIRAMGESGIPGFARVIAENHSGLNNERRQESVPALGKLGKVLRAQGGDIRRIHEVLAAARNDTCAIVAERVPQALKDTRHPEIRELLGEMRKSHWLSVKTAAGKTAEELGI